MLRTWSIMLYLDGGGRTFGGRSLSNLVTARQCVRQPAWLLRIRVHRFRGLAWRGPPRV